MRISLNFLKTALESGSYHQSQLYPRVFYKKDSVIITQLDGCVVVSHKQDTIASVIDSLKNGPDGFVLTDEGYISNDIGVDLKNNSYGTFKLS